MKPRSVVLIAFCSGESVRGNDAMLQFPGYEVYGECYTAEKNLAKSNNFCRLRLNIRRYAETRYSLVVKTLRARTTGRRIPIRVVAWRFALHNHADQADIGRQRLRLFRPRDLSAAPLGARKVLGITYCFC